MVQESQPLTVAERPLSHVSLPGTAKGVPHDARLLFSSSAQPLHQELAAYRYFIECILNVDPLVLHQLTNGIRSQLI